MQQQQLARKHQLSVWFTIIRINSWQLDGSAGFVVRWLWKAQFVFGCVSDMRHIEMVVLKLSLRCTNVAHILRMQMA